MASKIDFEKAKQVAQQVVGDVGTCVHGALCFIGDRLGLFKAMKESGPVTSDELAAKTGLSERYLREWLNAMAAAQYVTYDATARRFHLTPEYALVLADEESPFFVGSYFQMVQSAMSVAPKVADSFRTGKGVPQSEYPPWMFEASERNSFPRYKYKLVDKWIAALPEVVERLKVGGAAVDVGCGGGRAAILIAQAFPKARVFGYDLVAQSIERARRNARAAGVGDRVAFEVGDCVTLPDSKFDFITTFDVVHDAVDPVGLMNSIRRALAPGGTYLVQEINVSSKPEENHSALGKMVYSISTMYCMTTSLAHGGAGIGAAMGEVKARELAERAGFKHFRRLPIDDDFAVLYELKA
ncbi:MAG: class I SAM-dependent methyltransferase [Candidatus Binatus sp.]|uniref:class I SAM-dependent methyltransferase n=1 Tax=Candidatus Binatus sp. TaxID=2811406 RepID=UPI002727BD1E|nr:class I SAM-dependent methyltransferase [Candidatus Binatus sp.]MDO8432116.1 class I SAM-dependent methyltransferase [Candidatus Binatus sp.]